VRRTERRGQRRNRTSYDRCFSFALRLTIAYPAPRYDVNQGSQFGAGQCRTINACCVRGVFARLMSQIVVIMDEYWQMRSVHQLRVTLKEARFIIDPVLDRQIIIERG
jgi:hypothetical protein